MKIPEVLRKLMWRASYTGRALRRFGKLPRYTPGIFVLDGRQLQVADVQAFTYMFEEIWQNEIYKFNTNNPRPLIIDCGANIGLSVLYFKKRYPACRIVAFEPDSAIFEYLQKNVQRFGLTDVQCIKKGIWKEAGEVSFKGEGSDSGRIHNAEGVPSPGFQQSISTVTLSSVLTGPVDLLKIDIEGAEVDVLLEAREQLPICSNIFIEYHSFADAPQRLHELLSVLSEAGFRYYLSVPSELSRRPLVRMNTFLGMDGLVSIFASRNKFSFSSQPKIG